MRLLEELKLKRLVDGLESPTISECGWVNEREFYIWIDLDDLKEVLTYLLKWFGSDLLMDTSWNSYLTIDYVCLSLSNLFPDDTLKEIFPYEEYEH